MWAPDISKTGCTHLGTLCESRCQRANPFLIFTFLCCKWVIQFPFMTTAEACCFICWRESISEKQGVKKFNSHLLSLAGYLSWIWLFTPTVSKAHKCQSDRHFSAASGGSKGEKQRAKLLTSQYTEGRVRGEMQFILEKVLTFVRKFCWQEFTWPIYTLEDFPMRGVNSLRDETRY